jgi:hypothetical protein
VREFTGTRRFEVIRQLGEGGMGVVFEVLDRERGTRVALKTLRMKTPEHLLRFKSEFRALQDLNHHNLITLHELIEDQGQWFFTMELIDGVDFIRHLRAAPATDLGSAGQDETDPGLPVPGPLASLGFEEVRLRQMLPQLAQGLAALHRAGKVHRDVKPSNVMVTRDGRVVVLDFGLVADLTAPLAGDAAGAVVGTIEYMAPEQAMGAALGPSADWYSVGVMLYEAIVGTPPFYGRPMEVLQRKLETPPTPPSQRVPGVPPDLDRLCVDLLTIDPAVRLSGRAVLRRLNVRERELVEGAPSVFVGRDRELADLEGAFRASLRGEAAAILLRGEDGVGKSALVQKCIEQLRGISPELLLLRGRCFPREDVPYKAWDGVADGLSAELVARPLPLPDLVPEEGAALGRLFPILKRTSALAASPDDRLPSSPQELRRLATSALRSLLGALAQRRPVMMVIEDFQYADADSLLLLRELLQEPLPLFLLATLRGEHPWRGEKLPLSELALDPLSPLETRRLTEALAGRSRDDVVKESGGLPLFVHHLARHANTGKFKTLTLADSLWSDIERLPPEERALIDVLAVAGGELEQRIVERAGAIDATRFSSVIASLQVQKLVRTGGARRYDPIELAHSSIGATVRAHLPAERVNAVRSRLAEVVDAAGATPLGYFEAAGDRRNALAMCRLAAEQAAQALAFGRAVELYRKGVELASTVEERRPLMCALADSLADSGRGAEAAESYRRAAALAGEPERTDLLRKACEQLLRSGQLAEGLELLDGILRPVGLGLPKRGGAALASLLFHRLQLRLRGLKFALRHEDQVDPSLIRKIDLTFAVSSSLPLVDALRGADFATRNLLYALQAGEPMRLLRALAFEAGYQSTAGDASAERVAETLQLMRDLVHRTGDQAARYSLIAAIGSAEIFRGRFTDGLERLRSAEAGLRTLPAAAYNRVPLEAITCWALYYTGALGELARRVEIGLKDAGERGDRLRASSLSSGFCNLVWLCKDDPTGARRAVESAMGLWPKEPFQTQHLFGIVAECQIDLYLGDGAAALARLDENWERITRGRLPRVPFFNATRLHLRARARLAASRAEPRLRELALDDCARIESDGDRWAAVLARTLRAAVAPAERRAGELIDAARACDVEGLPLLAAICRFRAGDEAAEQANEARHWLEAQGVRAPERLARVFLPE